jgi:uncharacterized protein (DUF58 family)
MTALRTPGHPLSTAAAALPAIGTANAADAARATGRGWLRHRIDAWWQARSPRADSLLLTQRNVYILPTRGGLLFCATLVVLLVASINYQLNLGYLLTFLLAGCGVVSMHMTHNTLRGMTLHLRPTTAVFAGETALLEAVLSSPGDARHPGRARYGIGLRLRTADVSSAAYADVPAGTQSVLRIGFVPARRGLHDVPPLHLETRFPLGLFRAWAIWRPDATVLAYPQPERPASPLPAARAMPGGSARARTVQIGEFEGIRPYRRGDALKSIAWKHAAKTLASGGDLVSRDASMHSQQQLWLDWQCGAGGTEARLSRLTAWVIEADQRHLAWGLAMPGFDLGLGQGDAHRRAALEALALKA